MPDLCISVSKNLLKTTGGEFLVAEVVIVEVMEVVMIVIMSVLVCIGNV